jgi:very-short-patch-repair endonuclease
MRNSKIVSSETSALIEARAWGLRRALTRSEQTLWLALRGGQLGVSFRRQAPVAGRYIADFCAPSARLIVEVDGPWHRERRAADERRDRVLARCGYRVLRLDAELVVERLDEAVAQIRAALAEPR